MKYINEFIKQYHKEYDFYQKFSSTIADKIESQLRDGGIKAIVTYRAKKPDTLKEKIKRRNAQKQYKSIEEIRNDIVDLSGIRVALYFPTDRTIVDEVINKLFSVNKRKVFPESGYKPKYDKRFSGYWATHYRVCLKEDDEDIERYADIAAEIQVASVLMHAWSEVEHDLIYKPHTGDLSKEELAILDEINGLVLSGEIALERLHAAMAQRAKKQNNINNKYDLTNLLSHYVKEAYSDELKIGNTAILNNYLDSIDKLSVKSFEEYVKNIDVELEEPIVDQMLSMLLSGANTKRLNLKDYFNKLHVPEDKIAEFESFVKCWIILEKAMKSIYPNEKLLMLSSNAELLKRDSVLSSRDIRTLLELRKIRSEFLHGSKNIAEHNGEKLFNQLKLITLKVINKVPTKTLKKALEEELKEI
ncbi:GTP pyrophosphokinase [Neisseria sp. Ec49-e6-T10]|uniref:GTP pyrophosphokinase n=1 Tax=Neisseria sp. Ec49-e6-T10 TaxID=3140744 RepID=UPI003EBEE9AF